MKQLPNQLDEYLDLRLKENRKEVERTIEIKDSKITFVLFQIISNNILQIIATDEDQMPLYKQEVIMTTEQIETINKEIISRGESRKPSLQDTQEDRYRGMDVWQEMEAQLESEPRVMCDYLPDRYNTIKLEEVLTIMGFSKETIICEIQKVEKEMEQWKKYGGDTRRNIKFGMLFCQNFINNFKF
jgi:hypothetical protein